LKLIRKKWIIILCLVGVSAVVIFYHLEGSRSRPQELDNMLSGATPAAEGDVELVEAMFYESLSDNSVQCSLCFRNCVIPEGERGFCRNRENKEGKLYTLVYGQASAVHVDPVEKEPIHHFLPGESMLCIGTASCNFRCKFCHNWHMSQRSIEELNIREYMPPKKVVSRAQNHGLPAISFTYNEPTVFYEYMYDTAREAQKEGLKVIFHTNGSLNPEPLRKLLPYIDGVTVDLKGFEDSYYREMTQGELDTVLETLQIIEEKDVWLEIVNLVLPGLNDDPETVRDMSRWIIDNLDSKTPVHFSRFFPSYKMQDLSPTPVGTIEQLAQIAKNEGLKFVSIGNVPGHRLNSTFCDNCGSRIINRHHFTVRNLKIDDEGKCMDCGHEIPGVWR